jgi:enediyne biosynthesis protein E4
MSRRWWPVLSALCLLACFASWRFVRVPPPPLPAGVERDEYDLAADAYRDRYGTRPERLDVLSWLGESYVAQRRFDEAVSCFHEIPSSHPKYGRAARYLHGQVLLELDRAADAERQFRELISLEESSPSLPHDQLVDASKRLRFILEVELRFEERQELLRGVVTRGEAEPFELAAFCFPTQLRWWGSDAAGWLDEFLAKTPDDPTLQLALIRFRTAQGRLDEARTLFEQYLPNHPQDPATLAAGLTLYRQQDDAPAFDRLARSLPSPSPADTWGLRYWRGRIARERGDFEAALRELLALVRDVPAHAEAWRELVEVTRLAGRERLRDVAAKRVQVLGGIANRLGLALPKPREPRAWIEIAQLCDEGGLAPEARLVASYALTLQPGDQRLVQLAAGSTRAANLDDELARAIVAQRSATPASPKSSELSSTHRIASVRPPLRFREITDETGVRFTRFDDIRDERRIHEGPGGGVALADFDGNGWDDLVFTDGCRLPLREKTREHANTLWLARGDGTYRNVAALAGVDESGYFTGVGVADWDNDGFPDLCVTAFRGLSLWRNQGDGTFTRVVPEIPSAPDRWSTSVAFLDAENDGDLDLFVATYVVADDDPPVICRDPSSPTGTVACPPTHFPAQEDLFLLNDGAGGFVDATAAANLAGHDGKGLGAVAFDYDQDGRLDLYVANDGTPCFLHHNITPPPGPDGTPTSPKFEDVAILTGVALDGAGVATAAMGVSTADLDRDGWLDLTKANFYLESNTVYRNEAGQSFADISAPTRIGPVSRQTLGFGTEFFDADNDGWPDLVTANGHIEDRAWSGKEPYRMRHHLFRNRGDATFDDVADAAGPYFAAQWVARGVAVGDLDHDGRLDLALNHQIDRSVVLRNETAVDAPVWQFRFVGREDVGRLPIGLRMKAVGIEPPLVRELTGGGSFQSNSAPELHFAGIPRAADGSEPVVPFTLRWPGGTTQTTAPLAPGRYVVIQGEPPRRQR